MHREGYLTYPKTIPHSFRDVLVVFFPDNHFRYGMTKLYL